MGSGQIVAHAGEEFLLVVAAGWIVYLLFRGMRGERLDGPSDGPCLYCGTELTDEVERCPTCGFRARRGVLGAEPAERVLSSGPRTPPA